MRWLSALGLSAALLAGCTSNDPAPDADGASAGALEVEIGDYVFDDDRLSIEVGDTVTWTHRGDITHNVTSRDGSFASDDLGPGDTFTHTFDAAGSFDYVCTLHGQMVADVVVG